MEGKECLEKITICRIENIKRLKEKYARKNIRKLDANENPRCINLKRRTIKKAFKNLNYYPDTDCSMLSKELEKRLMLTEKNFLFGNGSSEIISLIIKAFINPKEKVITPFPTFMPYITESKIAQAEIEYISLTKDYKIDLNEILNKIDDKTKIIFVVNPHNPTGTIISENEFDSFLKKVSKNILVVLDEAYIEYLNENKKMNIKKLINKYKNLCVIRTFSKAYGLAGLRIGYLVANENIIDIIKKVKLPVNISCVAEYIATETLKNDKYLKTTINKNNKIKKYLYKNLKEFNIPFIESETNFVMVDFENIAEKIKNILIEHGIVVNGNFHEMENFLRITIGNKKDIKKLVKILKEV
ncbi:MAG: histidinol-phosphate transaminase [Clostridia bacterium]|nr:histidinol-phosphate transaminase [Clostridia bacterium]